MTTSNAEAAARRARETAHGLLEGQCRDVDYVRVFFHSTTCDRIAAHLEATETRLAAAEEALLAHKELSYRRGYLSGIQRVCAETNTEEAEDNNPDDELERLGLWLGEESARAKKAVDNATRPLAEPPGEGAGALTPPADLPPGETR